MTILFTRVSRIALGAAVVAATATMALEAQAQEVLTFASYGENLALNVPTLAATSTCTPLPATTPVAAVKLRKTFLEPFDTMPDLTKRFTPHLGGTYDAVNKVWLGYDWLVKRTQTAGHEQQLYVDPDYKGLSKTSLAFQPFSVENGTLHIVAQKTPDNLKAMLSGYEYTSGALTTRKSFAQRYGYFEARLKVPATQGLLPAFWMVSTVNVWPPELDIMEAPTHLPNKISQNVHWLDAKGQLADSSCKIDFAKYSTGFHQYGAYWTADKIVYYIDRVPVSQIKTPPGLNLPMYMIVNLAVGGDWVGKATAATPIPAEMLVDVMAAWSTDGSTACGTTTEGVLQCPAK